MTAEEIHAKIKGLMDERDWTNYKLVEECKKKDSNVNKSTIFGMLKRKSYPTIPVLQQLCKGFGITLAEFFKDESTGLTVYQSDKPLLDRCHQMTEKMQDQCLDMMDVIIKHKEDLIKESEE